MLTHALNALARKRNSLGEKEKGFTLIELLVVVIIIGILAAIAIPVYLGVQNNAKDSAVQSDVVNAKTAAVSLETDTGTLPVAATDLTISTWTKAGATQSTNTSALTYTPSSDIASGFCIEGTSTTGTTFAADQTAGATKGATCSAAGDLVP